MLFKFENPTPGQTLATIVHPTVIYPCFYLRNDRTDSCYCRNGKVTPDAGPKEKRRILQELTPVIRIWSHLCQVSRLIASHEAKTKLKLHALTLIPIAILQCLRKVNLALSKNKTFR